VRDYRFATLHPRRRVRTVPKYNEHNLIRQQLLITANAVGAKLKPAPPYHDDFAMVEPLFFNKKEGGGKFST